MSFNPLELLGWVKPDDRTNEQNDAHAVAEASMPQFAVPASGRNEIFEATGKFLISDLWKHPRTLKALGYQFKRMHQLTGSCVGAGGGSALFSLIAGDAIFRGENEEIFLPFWPYDYALSRQLGGWNSRGDGSLGSLFARAVRDDGVLRADMEGLPKLRNYDDEGVILTDTDNWNTKQAQHLEFDWSVGKNIAAALIAAGKVHPVKTSAPIRSVDDLKTAILNRHPCTFASDRFIGNGTIKGSGDSACVVGHLDSDGGHQTSIQGVWEHPQFGLMFNNQNNWPAQTYPRDPAGANICSVWQSADDIDKAIRQFHVEIYAFSGIEGFPGRDTVIDWMEL